MKFDIQIPKYLVQDKSGEIYTFSDKPKPNSNYEIWMGDTVQYIDIGIINENWQNTLIDLETDDYDFEDGILKRLPKKG